MKKSPVRVECVFDESGRDVHEIVLNSFRLYLRERLSEKPVPQTLERKP